MHILLVRHGETPWNQDGRYQGRTDIPLADTGLRQVQKLSERLAGLAITRAVASPLKRAFRTAEIIVGTRALPIATEPRFLEICHGEWEGCLAEDLQAKYPEMFAKYRAGPPADFPAGPGGESFGQVLARAWAGFEAATTGLTDADTLLVVAHDAVNRVILCNVLGLPLARIWAFRQAPASLNVLAGPSVDRLQVVRLNDAEHVAPLLQEAVHRAV